MKEKILELTTILLRIVISIGVIVLFCITILRMHKKIEILEGINSQYCSELSEKEMQNVELTNQFNYVVQNKSTDVQALFKAIEPLKKENRQSYLRWYKAIYRQYNNVLDPYETIYDYSTDEEFNLICRVVQAEIGNGTFDQKCNVASVIVNRYYSKDFSNNWKDILFQKYDGVYQFSSIGNGAYKKVDVDKSTIEAIEYAFTIGDTTNGATYFHSGKSKWHENNLHFIFDDGKHKFYKVK